ncbi:MAG: FAD-dependent monooxygenase [Steroidobacteraceae bacterium]
MTAGRRVARGAPDCDVLVVGGGAVGATFAALLPHVTSLDAARITLLDPQLAVEPPGRTAGASAGLRVSAISRASERILMRAQAWPAIAASDPCPYERMHVWPHDVPARAAGALVFDAASLHEPDLGHIVDNRVLQAASLASFAAAGGRLVAARVGSLQFESGGVRATLERDADRSTTALTARLVVGADGARSVVRRLAGLEARVEDYLQLGVVARVRPERPHEATAWQRFLGHGTLALLPLASGECSIVWSLSQAEARRLLAVAPAQFEQELTAASDGVLGALQLTSERLAPPLQRLLAPQYAVERVALIGDAAHVVHPLAGQGVNLGLLDAAALAEVLAAALGEGEDPGALRVLRRYERWRKGENEAMSLAFDAFNALLSTGQGTLATLARRSLGWVERSELAKRFFLERALGTAGDLPAAARAAAAIS